MAGPDAHGAQNPEQSITVDSLHSPPFPAPPGARQGDPGPVHRVIPGGGRHDRPATRPTDRSGSVPPSNRGGTLLPPALLPPSQSDPPPHPAGVAGPREAAPLGTGLEHLTPSPTGPPPRHHHSTGTTPAPAGNGHRDHPRNRPPPTDKRRGTPACQRSPSPCCGLRAPSVAGPTSGSGVVATVTSAGRRGRGPRAGSSLSGIGERIRSAVTARHGDACPGVLDGSSRGAPTVDEPKS